MTAMWGGWVKGWGKKRERTHWPGQQCSDYGWVEAGEGMGRINDDEKK